MATKFTFTRAEATKNKVKYENELFGVLYVPKSSVEELGNPDVLKMELTAGE